MMLRRLDLRRFGNVLALGGWLLLVSDPCVDIGTIHAPIGPTSAHGAEDQTEARGHAECPSAALVSADRDSLPAGSGMDTTGSPVSATVSCSANLSAPGESPGKLRWTEMTRSRSPAPLYLLHAVFLI